MARVFLNFEQAYFPFGFIDTVSYLPGPGVAFFMLISISSGNLSFRVKGWSLKEDPKLYIPGGGILFFASTSALTVPNLTFQKPKPRVVDRLLMGNFDVLQLLGPGAKVLFEKLTLFPNPKVQDLLFSGILGVYLKSVSLGDMVVTFWYRAENGMLLRRSGFICYRKCFGYGSGSEVRD